jgi:hypothetical protein
VDYLVLEDVLEGYKDLDRESLSECDREALEIIIFDELIKVDAKHLERYENMISESETVPNGHNIPLLLRIIISQHG